MAWQQLKMAVRLAGASFGTAVEEPQPRCVAVDCDQGLPVPEVQPSALWCPLTRDQEHVADLNRVFVQDQNVLVCDFADLESSVPGLEGIGFGTC